MERPPATWDVGSIYIGFPSGLALSGSCSSSRTTLAIDLKTDLVPGPEFARVATHFDSERVAMRDVSFDDDFFRGLRVAELTDLAPGNHLLRVELLDQSGSVVLDRTATLQLDRDRVLTFLMTRDCRGVVCQGGEDSVNTTCIGGVCASPRCTDGPAAEGLPSVCSTAIAHRPQDAHCPDATPGFAPLRWITRCVGPTRIATRIAGVGAYRSASSVRSSRRLGSKSS